MKLMRALPVAFLLAFLSGSAASPRLTPPTLRLGDNVRPTRYAVELEVVPTRDTFTGTIDIDVRLLEAEPVIWLNARNLTIKSAAIEAGGKTMQATPALRHDDVLGLQASEPVPAGPARIRISYEGKFFQKSSEGLFVNKLAGDSYVFSQFEPTAAREAFPCFDQPQFKTPWQLTLRVPSGDSAFSNTPVLSESAAAGGL
ncbi:MAG: M1 family peptidase, partial [Acidobacteria bacterium]|nr:M1 family peptidase [Acidobacteriota bacterium]